MRESSKAHEQVLIAVLEAIRRTRGQKAPDLNFLKSCGRSIFEEDLLDWSGVPEELVASGRLEDKSGEYHLTALGLSEARPAYRDFFSSCFDNSLVRCAQSPTHSKYCELVYGRDLCQFNAANMEQLDKLLEVLALDDKQRVLDIGCGVGKIAEYIADATGAHVTAIDYAPGAIELARKRTGAKAGRLLYEVGDFNELELLTGPFDAVVAIDVLYFAIFFSRTLEQLKRLVSPGGQMGLLFSQIIPPDGPREKLLAEKTVLAEELTRQGLNFQTWDFTASDRKFWPLALETARKFKEAFEAEGNLEVCESHISEAEQMAAVGKDNRTTRFLYHVRI